MQADSPRAAVTTPAVTPKREIRRLLPSELPITSWTDRGRSRRGSTNAGCDREAVRRNEEPISADSLTAHVPGVEVSGKRVQRMTAERHLGRPSCTIDRSDRRTDRRGLCRRAQRLERRPVDEAPVGGTRTRRRRIVSVGVERLASIVGDDGPKTRPHHCQRRRLSSPVCRRRERVRSRRETAGRHRPPEVSDTVAPDLPWSPITREQVQRASVHRQLALTIAPDDGAQSPTHAAADGDPSSRRHRHPVVGAVAGACAGAANRSSTKT